MVRSIKIALLSFIAALCVVPRPGLADDIADFFKGKSIDFYVSSTPGGGNDLAARLIARHLRSNIPGQPAVVVRNMPGVGGITAANYLFNQAPRDGLALGMVQASAFFGPFYGDNKAQFDVNKFNWLGSPADEVAALLLWHAVPVNSIEDARKRGLILGVSGGLNGMPAFYARLYNHIFGIDVKLVAGYPGQSEAFLAMERGENDGFPSVFWSSLKAARPQWIAEKKTKMIVQFGRRPHPELANVPFADDLLKDNPDMRALMAVAAAPVAFGRPILAPPDVPEARVAALRTALRATFNDPAYLAECDKLKMECAGASTGEELKKIITDAYASPPALVKKIRELATPH